MRILLAVCGSIAGVKTPEWITSLKENGHEVKLLLTPGGQALFKNESWASEAYSDVFVPNVSPDKYRKGEVEIPHIELAKWADGVLVVGATANTISGLANGAFSHLLQGVCLATTAPVWVAPAMNPRMWNHPAVVQNVSKIVSLGYMVLPVTKGQMACGDYGFGRLCDASVALSAIAFYQSMKEKMSGKRVLVTAGAARVAIDPVRFISNRSSGALGAALATVASAAGATVFFAHGVDSVVPNGPHTPLAWITNQDLEQQIFSLDNIDYVLHTAALSDFSVDVNQHKIGSDTAFSVPLHPIKKTLPKMKKWFPHAQVYAWKLDTNAARAQKKAHDMLRDFDISGVFINDLKTLGGAQSGAVKMKTNQGEIHFAPQSKQSLARAIWRTILGL